MILSPAQSKIASDTHRFRVVDCGRRFGKTTLAILEMVGKAVSKDDLRVAYIAPTYQQARDIAWDMLKSMTHNITVNANESRLELTIKTVKGGTSTIWLRGWEAVETLRGQKFDFIVIDEIASMRKFWANWHEVVRPTLTDTKGHGLFISTPKGWNHFYELFEQEKTDKDFKSFKFTSYDNPHLPKEEIDKAAEELTENAFAQEYMAEFKKMEGLVYKDFDKEIHLVDPSNVPTEGMRILGIDFGFTNPTAAVFAIVDYDNNWWIYDEVYKAGMNTEQTAEQLKNRMSDQHFTHIIGDSAAAQEIENLKVHGLGIVPVNKEKDSILAGIRLVADKLKVQGNGKPKLFVSKNCENVIWEFETYRYPDKRDDRNEAEEPVKENDHCMDAIRYLALTLNTPYNKPEPKRQMKYDPTTGRLLS